VLWRDRADGATELSQDESASTSGALPEDQTTLSKEEIIRIIGTAASAPIPPPPSPASPSPAGDHDVWNRSGTRD
jgi:hypothetical protein